MTERPRRTSSKMNKLLPNPEINELEKQNSDKYDIDYDDHKHDEDIPFKVLMNKNLYDIGIDDDILDDLNEWMTDNNYDTDAIIEDIKIAKLKGDDESNIHQYCQLKNQIKCYNNIKQFVIQNGRMFTLNHHILFCLSLCFEYDNISYLPISIRYIFALYLRYFHIFLEEVLF